MTTDAASAPLTKNRATRTMAMVDITAASGNASSVVNNATSGLSATAPTMFAAPVSSRLRAAPPRMANQIKLTTLGATLAAPMRALGNWALTHGDRVEAARERYDARTQLRSAA